MTHAVLLKKAVINNAIQNHQSDPSKTTEDLPLLEMLNQKLAQLSKLLKVDMNLLDKYVAALPAPKTPFLLQIVERSVSDYPNSSGLRNFSIKV